MDYDQESKLARVPNKINEHGSLSRDGMGPSGNGRIYSVISQVKSPNNNNLNSEKLNNSTTIADYPRKHF